MYFLFNKYFLSNRETDDNAFWTVFLVSDFETCLQKENTLMGKLKSNASTEDIKGLFQHIHKRCVQQWCSQC